MNKIDYLYGAVFSKIINSGAVNIRKYEHNNSSFIINNKIGIYNKYSTKRISPWTFTFINAHIDEIKIMNDEFEFIYIILICCENGICCLNYKEYCTVLSVENRISPKTITARRKKGEKYTVSGSDGKLKYKIGNSDFPEKILVVGTASVSGAI